MDHRDDGSVWGLIGLVGLLGLAASCAVTGRPDRRPRENESAVRNGLQSRTLCTLSPVVI